MTVIREATQPTQPDARMGKGKCPFIHSSSMVAAEITPQRHPTLPEMVRTVWEYPTYVGRKKTNSTISTSSDYSPTMEEGYRMATKAVFLKLAADRYVTQMQHVLAGGTQENTWEKLGLSTYSPSDTLTQKFLFDVQKVVHASALELYNAYLAVLSDAKYQDGRLNDLRSSLFHLDDLNMGTTDVSFTVHNGRRVLTDELTEVLSHAYEQTTDGQQITVGDFFAVAGSSEKYAFPLAALDAKTFGTLFLEEELEGRVAFNTSLPYAQFDGEKLSVAPLKHHPLSKEAMEDPKRPKPWGCSALVNDSVFTEIGIGTPHGYQNAIHAFTSLTIEVAKSLLMQQDAQATIPKGRRHVQSN